VTATPFLTRPDFMDALDQYERYFDGADDLMRGEASPWYSWYPYITDVPERIHSLLPDVKLIYLVRDPVERAVAFYWEQFASNRALEFEAAFADLEDPRHRYACASKYALQVEQYLPLFPRSELLIVDSEDLKQARHETLRSIFSFLGVDPDFSSPHFNEELNSVAGKRRATTLGRLLKHSPPAVAIRRTLPVQTRQYLFAPVRRATSHQVRRRPLPDDLRRRLEDVLRPDIQRFRELTARSFENWSV
jgi:sulfotransferase family protein